MANGEVNLEERRRRALRNFGMICARFKFGALGEIKFKEGFPYMATQIFKQVIFDMDEKEFERKYLQERTIN